MVANDLAYPIGPQWVNLLCPIFGRATRPGVYREPWFGLRVMRSGHSGSPLVPEAIAGLYSAPALSARGDFRAAGSVGPEGSRSSGLVPVGRWRTMPPSGRGAFGQRGSGTAGC
jgi:hypothetical protein